MPDLLPLLSSVQGVPQDSLDLLLRARQTELHPRIRHLPHGHAKRHRRAPTKRDVPLMVRRGRGHTPLHHFGGLAPGCDRLPPVVALPSFPEIPQAFRHGAPVPFRTSLTPLTASLFDQVFVYDTVVALRPVHLLLLPRVLGHERGWPRPEPSGPRREIRKTSGSPRTHRDGSQGHGSRGHCRRPVAELAAGGRTRKLIRRRLLLELREQLRLLVLGLEGVHQGFQKPDLPRELGTANPPFHQPDELLYKLGRVTEPVEVILQPHPQQSEYPHAHLDLPLLVRPLVVLGPQHLQQLRRRDKVVVGQKYNVHKILIQRPWIE
mmetsp:Transcript_19237/g.53978  ORF Transcript_19237/g.53978 Transcript_19237/m.53978 type:complete len:321 (+) Transcript_19237:1702-2664(+)